jgi:NTE family protein
MSSGFFSFFAHTGFLTVLEDEGLLPSRVSGSSAGALVGAAWASGLDAPVLADELERLQRRDFWDPGFGVGLLRGRLFRERLERLLPTPSFDRCRIPAAVSVFEVRSRSTHVVRDGDIARAIHASCAVPFLFHPVMIDGRAYLDGGIRDRPGLEGMPRTEKRVLFHHIEGSPRPKRAGMVTLVLRSLPRSGPFRLDEGRRAYRVAKEATKRALDRTIDDDFVVSL